MKKLTIIIPAILFVFGLNAQVNYGENKIDGEYASALGTENTSSGTYSFVSGYNSVSSGYASFANGKDCDATGRYSTALGLNANAQGFWSAAIGSHSTALGTGAIAIGNQVDALYSYSYVIGEGTSNYHLVNNISSSFMVGFQSDIPTFFVGSSSGQGTFGKVGIGTTEPIATLDVNGDLNFSGNLLQNGQEFSNSPWTERLGGIYYTGGNVGIGTTNPSAKLDVSGDLNFTGNLLQNGQIFESSPWDENGNNIYFNTGNVQIGSTPSGYGTYAGLQINREGDVNGGMWSSIPHPFAIAGDKRVLVMGTDENTCYIKSYYFKTKDEKAGGCYSGYFLLQFHGVE